MRVAIIGAGAMGRRHAAALREIDDVEIVAIGARSAAPPAADLAREHGADLLAIDPLLARPDIDAVVIATPTDTHLELVRAAAQAGKQIICEKPLARTLAEGAALIDAARQAGVRLALAHVVRYFPAYAWARDAVARGEIGEPIALRATRGGSFPTVASGWYADLGRSGGVALDLIIHDFDWARWAFGPIERVHAAGLAFAGQANKDAAHVLLRFRSGARGLVEGSWGYSSVFRTRFELTGSRGVLRHDSRASEPPAGDDPPNRAGEPGGVALPRTDPHDDPYVLQMRDLVGWLRGGPPPRCTPEDAFEALRVSLAALESIRSGRPITLG